MEIIEKELSEYEKKEVKALIDRVVALNKEETLYYVHLAERKSQLMSGFSLNEYDPLQPSNMMDNQNFWPKEKLQKNSMNQSYWFLMFRSLEESFKISLQKMKFSHN